VEVDIFLRTTLFFPVLNNIPERLYYKVTKAESLLPCKLLLNPVQTCFQGPAEICVWNGVAYESWFPKNLQNLHIDYILLTGFRDSGTKIE